VYVGTSAGRKREATRLRMSNRTLTFEGRVRGSNGTVVDNAF